MYMSPSMRLIGLIFLVSIIFISAADVIVDVISEGSGPPVTPEYRYKSMVTLYIENSDGSKTPSGWSTRKSDGATHDKPFLFQPGVNLIKGWTDGVLRMKEGERSLIHVPPELGYGNAPVGSPDGAFYIPAGSHLLFDIEIYGKVDSVIGDL
mmetsp:Transcript_21843/g.29063  ORF Transcript_21843/g.29063 Transcript_21843/m.29063 type:complete len:152 (-) Transcript_21843:1353-1808(-)